MKTIKLEPGAFNHELLQLIGPGKVGWNSDDHGHFVDALLPRLIDEKNERVVLNDRALDIVKLVLHPTEELQRRLLKQAFADMDYALESNTEAAFVSMFDQVGFGHYLSTKKNPKTEKPYITKATKGAKKGALDALMNEEPVSKIAETTNTVVVEEVTSPAPVQPVPVENQTLAVAK